MKNKKRNRNLKDDWLEASGTDPKTGGFSLRILMGSPFAAFLWDKRIELSSGKDIEPAYKEFLKEEGYSNEQIQAIIQLSKEEKEKARGNEERKILNKTNKGITSKGITNIQTKGK